MFVHLDAAHAALVAAEAAVLVAVAEVDEAANSAPNEEANPSVQGEIPHEIAADENSGGGYEPDERTFEAARDVRLCHAEHHDADRSDCECRQSADVCHFCNDPDRCESCDTGDKDRTEYCDDVWCMVALMNLADIGGNHAVTAHGKEDACLPVEKYEKHCRDAGNRADADERRAKVITDVAKCVCHRFWAVELRVGNDARENTGDDDVEERADDERTDDADWKVARGVLTFFCRCCNGVKADVGKEDNRCTCCNALHAKRHERLPVGRVHLRTCEKKEDEDRCEFYKDENAVDF